MNKMEKTNVKWLEYMRNEYDGTGRCPNNHRLVYYPSRTKDGKIKDVFVITCPKSECEYYDYSTYTDNNVRNILRLDTYERRNR